MVQNLDQITSYQELVDRDPTGEWVQFNNQKLPYDYKDMASAAFDQAYYFGLGAKVYEGYRNLTDTEEKIPAALLNKEYDTDIFKVDTSRALADDLIAMNKRRQELDAIVSQGTGSFASDTLPYFAGQLAGGLVDPTSYPLGVGAAVVTAGIKRKGLQIAAEALVGGIAQAGGYQALAPIQGEERSISTFAQDVALGAIVEMGIGAGMRQVGKIKTGGTLLNNSYNKLKARGKITAEKVQVYAKSMFDSGKKVDVDSFLEATSPAKELNPVPDLGPKKAFVVKNKQGDYVSVGDSVPSEILGSQKMEDLKDILQGENGPNDVEVFDYSASKVKSYESTTEIVNDILKTVSEEDFPPTIAKKFSDIVLKSQADVSTIYAQFKKAFPDAAERLVNQWKKEADVVEIGSGRVVVNPDNVSKSTVSPTKEAFKTDDSLTLNRQKDMTEHQNSFKSDMDYDQEAHNSVQTFDDEFNSVESTKVEELEGDLDQVLKTMEDEGELDAISTKELTDIKENATMFTSMEKVYKGFMECLYKGGK